MSDEPSVRPFRRVAVLGLGLIGGSIALRCVQRGYDVVGYAASAATRELAAAHFEVADSAAAAVTGADLVVLAVPLRAMMTTALAIAPALDPGAAITDAGSVKAPVRAAIEAAGLGAQYVGAHPMAGNEHTGFAHADPTLLVGATWAVTHCESTDRTRRGLLFQWVSDTFDANIVELTEAEHDTAQALISGLPHVLAVELLNQVAASSSSETALQLAAGSFRDGTRVAHTDPERTLALVSENAAAVVPLIKRAASDLTKLADTLANDGDASAFFHAADRIRTS